MNLNTHLTLSTLLFISLSCSEKKGEPAGPPKNAEPKTEEHFLITDAGDTIPTGVPIPAKGRWIDPDSVAKLKRVPIKGNPKVVPAHTNVYPAGTPKVVKIPEKLTVITPGKDGIPLPKTVPAKGKMAPAQQPKPVVALSLRMRDQAIADIPYLDVAQGMLSSSIKTMLEDSRGNIWFAAEDGGVSRYDPVNDRGSSIKYTTKEGLSDNGIASMVEDNQKNIWISTQKGITVLIPLSGKSLEGMVATADDYQFYTFGEENGLKRINIGSGVLDHHNRIWWGSADGLMMLDLNQFKLPTEPPRITLEHIDVQEKFVDFRRLRDTSYRNDFPFGESLNRSFDSVASFYNYPAGMTLPYDLHHLTFYLSSIDWAAPHKIRYSYLLEGLEKDWSSPRSENKVDYRNLPYGIFTFKAKAIGAAQVWREPFEYTFTIRPPWWLTWWAKAMYALAAGLLIYGFVRWRTAEQRKKLLEANRLNERLVQVDKLKDQFLANTSHELRTPLQGIIALSESLFDREEEPDKHLGDAIMAIFPKDPEASLNAAIDMQRLLRLYNDERISSGRQTIKMGIGLHTGPLIMGIIGDEKRMDAATIADTVNTASRIESLTKYYGASILASEDSLSK